MKPPPFTKGQQVRVPQVAPGEAGHGWRSDYVGMVFTVSECLTNGRGDVTVVVTPNEPEKWATPWASFSPGDLEPA